MLYASYGLLVVLDLETMGNEKKGIGMCINTNTASLLPEGMMGLVGTPERPFFIDEHWKRGEGLELKDWEAILSLSDPCDLNKALMIDLYHNWMERRALDPTCG